MIDVGIYELGFREKAASTVEKLSGNVEKNFKIVEAGDKHHGNRILIFKDNESKGYVVKPRQGVGERIFANLEEYVFNKIGIDLITNRPILDSEGLSVFSYINEEIIHDDNKSHYFFLYGIKGALLFCLLATDIGHENVIATNSSGPVIIDAETIFSPYKLQLNLKKANFDLNFDYCTLARTGFFSSNYIFSPIFSASQIHYLNSSEVGELRAMAERFPICDQFLDDIFDGFMLGVDMMQKSMQFVEEMLLMNDISALRIIIRPTRTYIQNMNTPLDLDFTAEELHQMANGDIPYFTYKSINCHQDKHEILKTIRQMILFCQKNKSFIKRQIYEAGFVNYA